MQLDSSVFCLSFCSLFSFPSIKSTATMDTGLALSVESRFFIILRISATAGKKVYIIYVDLIVFV